MKRLLNILMVLSLFFVTACSNQDSKKEEPVEEDAVETELLVADEEDKTKEEPKKEDNKEDKKEEKVETKKEESKKGTNTSSKKQDAEENKPSDKKEEVKEDPVGPSEEVNPNPGSSTGVIELPFVPAD